VAEEDLQRQASEALNSHYRIIEAIFEELGLTIETTGIPFLWALHRDGMEIGRYGLPFEDESIIIVERRPYHEQGDYEIFKLAEPDSLQKIKYFLTVWGNANP
jgi:hypothetical protein